MHIHKKDRWICAIKTLNHHETYMRKICVRGKKIDIRYHFKRYHVGTDSKVEKLSTSVELFEDKITTMQSAIDKEREKSPWNINLTLRGWYNREKWVPTYWRQNRFKYTRWVWSLSFIPHFEQAIALRTMIRFVSGEGGCLKHLFIFKNRGAEGEIGRAS